MINPVTNFINNQPNFTGAFKPCNNEVRSAFAAISDKLSGQLVEDTLVVSPMHDNSVISELESKGISFSQYTYAMFNPKYFKTASALKENLHNLLGTLTVS